LLCNESGLGVAFVFAHDVTAPRVGATEMLSALVTAPDAHELARAIADGADPARLQARALDIERRRRAIEKSFPRMPVRQRFCA